MKTIPVNIEHTPEGEWWITSSELLGNFAVGDTKEEALVNAKEMFAMTLGIDESEVKLEIVETRIPGNGENS